MSLKRKIKRRAKVIPLHTHLHLFAAPGVHALAEESGLPLDELFLTTLWMAREGLIKVSEELTPQDQPRLLTILPESMKDVIKFKRQLTADTLIDPPDLPSWYELRHTIFPDQPPPKQNLFPTYNGGIHALLDQTELPIDFLFLNLLRLASHGLIQPIEEKLPTGRVKLNFRLATNALHIKTFRLHYLNGEHFNVTDHDKWRELRDQLLGPVVPEPDDDT